VPKDKLMTIKDLDTCSKKVFQEITVVNRIESLLEDMNLVPCSMSEQLVIGDMVRNTNVFHASEIGRTTGKSPNGRYPMGCARALFYSYTNAPAEGSWTPRNRRILDTGTAIHGQLQMYLAEVAKRRKKTETFEKEAGISPETNSVADVLDISGHTDGIYTITLPHLSVRFGIEIKSINDAGFKATKSVHPEHAVQGTIYQACLDLPVMLFLYYNKNDSNMAEFLQVFDWHIWGEIEKKVNGVRECVYKKMMPLQEVGFGCKTCKYKAICKPPQRMRGTMTANAFRINRRPVEGVANANTGG
jgi:hypothetical protein